MILVDKYIVIVESNIFLDFISLIGRKLFLFYIFENKKN